jgi:HAD superfamily hydrolase (TIGR01509 family)
MIHRMDGLKAIIFDCFGVLYPDSYGAFFAKHHDLFNNDPHTFDTLNNQIDLGEIMEADLLAGFAKETGIPADLIRAEIEAHNHVDMELVELIKRLKTAYKIGLISNAGEEEITILVRDKVDVLLDAQVVSYEIGHAKPAPEIYRACIQRLAVQPEQCLFIDDNMVNIDAARKLNMKALHYPNFGNPPELLLNLVPGSNHES